MNKNQTQLKSFILYCDSHKEERFWQCLRNWAKDTVNPRINFILTAEIGNGNLVGYKNLRDTFYDE